MITNLLQKLIKTFTLVIISGLLTVIMFLIFMLASSDNLVFEDILFWSFIYNFIVFLINLPVAKDITTFGEKTFFSLDRKYNRKNWFKKITLSFVPVVWSLIVLYFFLNTSLENSALWELWVFLWFPISYILLYWWSSKQIHFLSK